VTEEILCLICSRGRGCFLFTTTSRLALETIQLPIQWISRGSFPGGNGVGPRSSI